MLTRKQHENLENRVKGWEQEQGVGGSAPTALKWKLGQIKLVSVGIQGSQVQHISSSESNYTALYAVLHQSLVQNAVILTRIQGGDLSGSREISQRGIFHCCDCSRGGLAPFPSLCLARVHSLRRLDSQASHVGPARNVICHHVVQRS